MRKLTRLISLLTAICILILPVAGDHPDDYQACPFPRTAQRLRHHAPLVIWQVGTNDARHGIPLEELTAVIETGIDQLRGSGIDVALLDLQYVTGRSGPIFARYQESLEQTTDWLGVTRIPRWQMMRQMLDSGQYRQADLITQDGLHTTDIPYQKTAYYTATLIAKRCGR